MTSFLKLTPSMKTLVAEEPCAPADDERVGAHRRRLQREDEVECLPDLHDPLVGLLLVRRRCDENRVSAGG